MPFLVIVAAGIAAISACNPYDPNLSPTPFFCGSAAPECPDGYTCMEPAGGGSAVCTEATPMGMCTMTYSGVLATWDFSGASGSQASTAATSSAPGATAASVSRAAALMASTGSGSINSSNWATSTQLDATKYYTLSIAPLTGCSLSLTSMSIDALSSTTGPASAAVATSADAFAQTATVSTTSPSTPTLSVSDASGSVEIRIYGYSATGTSGTMRVQNTLTVTGTMQ